LIKGIENLESVTLIKTHRKCLRAEAIALRIAKFSKLISRVCIIIVCDIAAVIARSVLDQISGTVDYIDKPLFILLFTVYGEFGLESVVQLQQTL